MIGARKIAGLLIVGLGCLAAGTNAQSITATYQYDSLGRIAQANNSDGSVIQYSYDAAGNRTQVVRKSVPPAITCSPGSYTFIGIPHTGAGNAPLTMTISGFRLFIASNGTCTDSLGLAMSMSAAPTVVSSTNSGIVSAYALGPITSASTTIALTWTGPGTTVISVPITDTAGTTGTATITLIRS